MTPFSPVIYTISPTKVVGTMAQTAQDIDLLSTTSAFDLRRSPTPSSRRLSASSRIMHPPSSASVEKPKSLDSVLSHETDNTLPPRGSSELITPPSSPRMFTNLNIMPVVARSEPEPSFEVRLPDMFASIMSVQAQMNPNYKLVKPEADAWTAS